MKITFTVNQIVNKLQHIRHQRYRLYRGLDKCFSRVHRPISAGRIPGSQSLAVEFADIPSRIPEVANFILVRPLALPSSINCNYGFIRAPVTAQADPCDPVAPPAPECRRVADGRFPRLRSEADPAPVASYVYPGFGDELAVLGPQNLLECMNDC